MNQKILSSKKNRLEKIGNTDFYQSNNPIERPYTAITNNIEVSVWPEFIDGKESLIGDIFVWAYHIRIQNDNPQPVKLLNRHWKIIDEKGNVSEVEGEGVVGEQPIIASKSSYQYSSGVHLRYPSGVMAGTYEMQQIENGKNFEVKIPHFSLDSPLSKEAVN